MSENLLDQNPDQAELNKMPAGIYSRWHFVRVVLNRLRVILLGEYYNGDAVSEIRRLKAENAQLRAELNEKIGEVEVLNSSVAASKHQVELMANVYQFAMSVVQTSTFRDLQDRRRVAGSGSNVAIP